MESIFLKLAQYPIVETERLLLRPVTLDDAEAMFAYASDKDNTRYTFLTNQNVEETKNNIAQFYLANPLQRQTRPHLALKPKVVRFCWIMWRY